MAPDKPKPHPLLEQPLLSPRPPTFASIPRINPPPQCQVHLPALHLTPVPLHMCLDTSAGAKQQETTWKQGAPRMLVTPKTCSWESSPQDDWGCWHSTDEHWGYLLQRPLDSPHREEEPCGHCCVDPCYSLGTMHMQAWKGQWNNHRASEQQGGCGWHFGVPGC